MWAIGLDVNSGWREKEGEEKKKILSLHKKKKKKSTVLLRLWVKLSTPVSMEATV